MLSLGQNGGDHDLMRFALTTDLGDKLLCGAVSGLGVAGIDGDNFRVQEFGQRRVTDAR